MIAGWRLPYIRNSPPNGLKGRSVWSAALGGEFTGDPTSLARDNMISHMQHRARTNVVVFDKGF